MNRRLRAAVTIATLLCSSFVFQAPAANAQGRWYNPEEGGQDKARAYQLYQQATQAFDMGDFNACIHLCREAKNYHHSSKEILHLEALALAESGDNYNAMMQFRAALSLDYNYIQCRNNWGMFLRKNGKPEEAMRAFRECIKIDPNYADAYYHLGELLQEKGDLDAAIENYQTAITKRPDYVDAQRDLGLALYEKYRSGQDVEISQSIEKLQQAARLMPDNPQIYYHLGNILCSQSKFDDAEASYRRSLMCDPKHAGSHWELARLRYFRGDPDRCIIEIKAAEKVNPVYSESKKYPAVDPIAMKLMLGVCYEVKGDLLNAVEAYKQAASMQSRNEATLAKVAQIEKVLRAGVRKKKNVLTFDPEEVEALIKKGISEAEDGNTDGAKRTFQRALELNPKSFEAVQHIGEVLEATGDLNGAMSKYQQAQALRPAYDGTYFNLAYILEKMNLNTDAGLMYQKFHEISGKYPYDPKHIVSLQQDEARRRARDEQIKRRGY